VTAHPYVDDEREAERTIIQTLLTIAARDGTDRDGHVDIATPFRPTGPAGGAGWRQPGPRHISGDSDDIDVDTTAFTPAGHGPLLTTDNPSADDDETDGYLR
jgi:hypothetical protein